MTPGERLKKARHKLGLSQEKLGIPVGFTNTKVRDLESGKQKITMEIAYLLEENFAISRDYLLDGTGDTILTSSSKPVHMLPVYARVPAGWPADCHIEDEPIGYVPFEGNGRNKGAILVDGDSMFPSIKNGQFAVYVEDYDIRPGDIVVATNEFNKPMIKEYAVKDGEPWLISINSEYSNHKVNENYKIIGRVIEVFDKKKVGRG